MLTFSPSILSAKPSPLTSWNVNVVLSSFEEAPKLGETPLLFLAWSVDFSPDCALFSVPELPLFGDLLGIGLPPTPTL